MFLPDSHRPEMRFKFLMVMLKICVGESGTFKGREQALPYRGRGGRNTTAIRGRGGRLRGSMKPRYNDLEYSDYPTDYTQVP